jgi:hypothetical protein
VKVNICHKRQRIVKVGSYGNKNKNMNLEEMGPSRLLKQIPVLKNKPEGGGGTTKKNRQTKLKMQVKFGTGLWTSHQCMLTMLIWNSM